VHPTARRSSARAATIVEQVLYADSSALVKLLVREPESAALAAWIPRNARVLSSDVSLIEVGRFLRVSGLADELETDLGDALSGCSLVDIDRSVVRAAAALASESLKPLDAIQLATALDVDPDAMLVYDRVLARAAARLGLRVESPGAEP
jgi:predicted nucleic acid-binding protein